MKRTLTSLFVCGGLLGFVGVARAQEAARLVEGSGYPIGEGTVFHPTVGMEAGFTDNVFYQDEGNRSSGLLRLIVEAAIASKRIQSDAPAANFEEGGEASAEPASQMIQFRAGGRVAYTEYLSGDSIVRSQRALGADLAANLVVAPQGTVSFAADEHFVRDTRPTNFYSTDGTNRIANSLALGLNYQPGGGTMKGGLRWENQIDFFEDEDQRFANRMINAVHARYEWAFFPFSKLFADVSYSFVGGLGSEGGAIEPTKRSSQPVRGGAGVATAITEQFTVKAHAGWAYASYEGGSSYNTPVAGVELGYRYSPFGRVVVAYNWDHRDSINGDYYRDHQFGAHVDQQVGRVVASLSGEARLRSYHGISPAVGMADRDDVIFGAGVQANYVFRDWLAAVAAFRGEIDQTDYRSLTLGGMMDDPSYTRVELTAGVRAAF